MNSFVEKAVLEFAPSRTDQCVVGFMLNSASQTGVVRQCFNVASRQKLIKQTNKTVSVSVAVAAQDSCSVLLRSKLDHHYTCHKKKPIAHNNLLLELISGFLWLAWLGLYWLGLAWLGLAWLGLCWGWLGWAGLACPRPSLHPRPSNCGALLHCSLLGTEGSAKAKGKRQFQAVQVRDLDRGVVMSAQNGQQDLALSDSPRKL